MPVFNPADVSATLSRSIQPMLDEAVRAATFPGCVVVAGNANGVQAVTTAGSLDGTSQSPRPTVATIYDVASLTKVVVTTTIAMILHEEQRLSLADPLTRFWSGVESAKKPITVGDLLAHRAGFAPHIELWHLASNRESAIRAILERPLQYAPGSDAVYSDLGMILLGSIIEQIEGQTLDVVASERVFQPLGMMRSLFCPPESCGPEIAPTCLDAPGLVHDRNARLFKGISGHAGLFSSAADLSIFSEVMLRKGCPLVKPKTWETFIRRQTSPILTTRALGWDTPSETGSSAGCILSRRSFGHTGFTGTSVWIDPDNDLYVVFLSNRVYRSEENLEIRSLRPRLHDKIARHWIGRKEAS